MQYVNRYLLDLLGYTHADIIGKHVEQLFNVGTRIFYQTHWFPLLRLHGRAEEIFLMLRTKAGADTGVLTYTARREGSDLYDCVAVPVRERAKYEEELLRARRAAERSNAELQQQKAELQRANEQLESQALELEFQGDQLREQAERLEELAATAADANRAKSGFLAMMSHELRTPLNAISGYLQILELGIAGPITDAQRDIIDRLDRSGRHLLNLINDVLDLSRIEAGRIVYHASQAELHAVVQEVIPLVEPQMSDKQIEFSVRIDPAIPVYADVDKVSQIVVNLLGNAAKFTAEQGSISIRAEHSHDEGVVRLHVSDSGVGVPPDQREAIFQPFVQADSARTRSVQGSGLGLAISREFARGMNGDLTVESEPGAGSTFTLTLPAAAPDTPDADTPARADTPVPD